MRIRLAKVDDAGQLATMHRICSRELPYNFEVSLGIGFLEQYYHVILAEKDSVVLCAEDEGRIVGISSGTLDYAEHKSALRRNRYRLLCGAAPALIRYPTLLWQLYARQSSNDSDSSVSSDAHFMYWAWLPTSHFAGGAIFLLRRWLALMRLLGARKVVGEVDRSNDQVAKIHWALGAKTVSEIITRDGISRLVIEYSL